MPSIRGPLRKRNPIQAPARVQVTVNGERQVGYSTLQNLQKISPSLGLGTTSDHANDRDESKPVLDWYGHVPVRFVPIRTIPTNIQYTFLPFRSSTFVRIRQEQLTSAFTALTAQVFFPLFLVTACALQM